MRMRDYAFAIAMCVLTLATAYRYGSVRRFVDRSREYSFVVEMDEAGMMRMKSDLRGATFQGVEGEAIDDGLYRITVRCPPDKVGLVWSLINRMSEKRAEE
jgi:hypothetical protein